MTEINPSEQTTSSSSASSGSETDPQTFSNLMSNGDPTGTTYSNSLEKFLGKDGYKKFEQQFEQSVSDQCSKARVKEKAASERLHKAQTGGDMWDAG